MREMQRVRQVYMPFVTIVMLFEALGAFTVTWIHVFLCAMRWMDRTIKVVTQFCSILSYICSKFRTAFSILNSLASALVYVLCLVKQPLWILEFLLRITTTASLSTKTRKSPWKTINKKYIFGLHFTYAFFISTCVCLRESPIFHDKTTIVLTYLFYLIIYIINHLI